MPDDTLSRAQTNADTLTGALIGLARCTDEATPTAHTYKIIIEGLYALSRAHPDDASLAALTDAAHAERDKLLPNCATCIAPCGHHEDFDLRELWGTGEETRYLKALILAGLRGMAGYVYHALAAGQSDDTVNQFLVRSLFTVGYDAATQENLLAICRELGAMALRAKGLLG